MDLNLSRLITSTSFITPIDPSGNAAHSVARGIETIYPSGNAQNILEEGADVNHQYLDLYNNTPLHLAIANKNVECVKLLLKQHPKLNIRNKEEETAEDLATKVSHNEIIKLLADYRNNEYDSIDPKFMFELDENFSSEEIVKLKDDENFRILRIKNCYSFKALFDKFRQKDFKEAFSEASHLFAFIIEVNKNNKDDFEFPFNIFSDKRPFIVITTQEAQLPKVYYYNRALKVERLVKLQCEPTLSYYISEANCCTLSCLIRDSVIAELEKRVTVQEGHTSGALDVLCIRLKKLFRSNLGLQISTLIDPLPSDLKECLLAYYDLSFVKLEDKWFDILISVIESNDIEILKLILRNGFQTDCQKEHINVAWNLEHFECVTELLETDSCFPDEFTLDLVGQTFDKLRAIISTRNSFHDAIKAGNIDMINDLIEKNPQWKFIYNKENKSAITIALESKQLKIYSELRSRGFSAGVDTSFDDVFNDLSVAEKCEIRENYRKFFTNIESSHLMHLLSQTQLHFNQNISNFYFDIVRLMYNKLDEIPEFQPVLKLLENCKKLKIVIDFTKSHVMDMDPMATDASSGMTYPISGYIYIAAGNYTEKFNDILGVLAHELMHYAMQVVYDNNCKPYESRDKVRKEQFEALLQKVKSYWDENYESTNDVISYVFDCYPETYWHAELIVRVPHLCALLMEDKETLNILKQGYCKELFKFYSDTTLVEIKDKCELIEPQTEIEEINKSIGLLQEIQNYGYEISISQLNLFEGLQNLEPMVINTNIPMLTLVSIYQQLFKLFGSQVKNNIIFADVESFINRHFSERIKIVCDSKVNPVLVIKADEKDCLYESLERIKCLTNKLLLVTCKNIISKEDTKNLNFKYLNLTHVWEDLNQNSQKALMQRKVIFQGNKIRLNEVLPVDLNELNHFPLDDLFSDQLKVNNFEQKQNRTISQSFYVNRKFIVRKVQIDELRNLNSSDTRIVETEINDDGIIQEAQIRRVLIISDVAGMGKSTSLFEIMKTLQDKHKTHWVQFVDLKQHIRTFEQIKKSQKPVKKLHEVLQKCINKSLDQMIFLKLYEAGKTIILLDGVDEVCPDYNNFIMEALKSFDVNSGNQLWIATRVHLQEGLEKQLGQLACKLLPITFEDQVDIVANYWKSKNENVQDLSDLKTLASNLIAKMSKGLKKSKSDLMEIPLQIRMIAEIYNGLTKGNIQEVGEINLYSIYKAFYEKTLDNCLENKGPLPSVTLKEMIKSSEISILAAHQTIALCHFFGSDFDFQDDVEDLAQETKELIDKVGIAYFDSETEKYCFIHESFAEYFVANYILANLKRKVQKQVSQLFYLILTTEKYQMIRSFLDEAFKSKVMPENLCFDSLEKYLEEQKSFKLLYGSVREGLDTLVKFIFPTMDSFKNKELKKEILRYKTKRNFTILMFACNRINFDGETLTVVCEYLVKLLNEKELRILLLEKNENGANALHLVLTWCNQNNVQLLLKMVTNLFNAEELNKMICCSNKNRRNIWHFAARNDKNTNIFTTIRDSLKEVLSDNEIVPMLRKQDNDGYNVFHFMIICNNETALDDFKAFVQSLFKNKEELKLYLTEKTEGHCSNVLHLTARNSKNYFFREIWKFLQFTIDSVELKDMLLETNKNGWNIWHFATRNIEKEMLAHLHNHLKSVLSQKDIKSLLIQTSKHRSNIFHIAVEANSSNNVEMLWDILKEYLDINEQKILLQSYDADLDNIFHLAAYNAHHNFIFKALKNCSQNVLTSDEVKSLLQQKNILGFNVLQVLVSKNNESVLKEFYEMMKTFFDRNEFQRYFVEKSISQLNAIQLMASRNKNINFHKSFIQIMMEVFSDSKTEIKKMYLEKDDNGQSAFAFAVANNHKELYQSIWKFLSKICSFDEKTEILVSLGNKAVETAFDLFNLFDNDEDFRFLMNFTQSQLQ